MSIDIDNKLKGTVTQKNSILIFSRCTQSQLTPQKAYSVTPDNKAPTSQSTDVLVFSLMSDRKSPEMREHLIHFHLKSLCDREKAASIWSLLIRIAHYSQFACFPTNTHHAFFIRGPFPPSSQDSQSHVILTLKIRAARAGADARYRKRGRRIVLESLSRLCLLFLMQTDGEHWIPRGINRGAQMFCQLMPVKSNHFSIDIILPTRPRLTCEVSPSNETFDK